MKNSNNTIAKHASSTGGKLSRVLSKSEKNIINNIKSKKSSKKHKKYFPTLKT